MSVFSLSIPVGFRGHGVGKAAAVLALAGQAMAADVSTPAVNTFSWSRPIEGSLQPGQTYRIQIPDSVYHGSRFFPLDLQIVDSLHEAWPLTVWTDEPSVVYRAVRVETKERVAPLAGGAKYRAVFLKALAPPGESAGVQHNRLTLYTQGVNYLRRVEIQGSPDQENWTRVGVGYLVHDGRGVSVNKRVVTYPDSTFPFLEIRIFADPQKAGDDPAVLQIELGHQEERWPSLDNIPLTLLPDDDDAPAKDDPAACILDSGVVNRPLDRLQVEVKGKSFHHAFKLSGCNYQPFSWRWVADGEIHRVSDEEVDTLELKRCAYRYLKLEWVVGPDGHPPRLERATGYALPRFLVFEAGLGASPVLYFGSDQIPERRLPRQMVRDEQQTGQAPLVQLQEEAPAPDRYRAGAWRTAMPLLVAVGGFIVLVILLKRLTAKPRPPVPPPR